MFNEITNILYPDHVEVIAFPNGNVFPIFKNASSSLLQYAKTTNTKIVFNEQIRKLDAIEVILRDPLPRFISGVATYVGNELKQNPNLDINTILYFVENYLFLNRHYAPQLSWLINLNRFSKAKLKLHNLDAVSMFTPLDWKTPKNIEFDSATIIRLSNNIHNEMYLRLDNLLLQLIGQELTFKEILAYLKQQDPQAYQKLQCIALD